MSGPTQNPATSLVVAGIQLLAQVSFFPYSLFYSLRDFKTCWYKTLKGRCCQRCSHSSKLLILYSVALSVMQSQPSLEGGSSLIPPTYHTQIPMQAIMQATQDNKTMTIQTLCTYQSHIPAINKGPNSCTIHVT